MESNELTLKLRDVRAASGLSLSKVAELTGVSKAMLGQIERGESSPTIATLWKIAKGFQLPLSALIGTAAMRDTTDTDVFSTVTFPGSIEVKIVFPFDPALGAETFHVELSPNQSHESPAHAAGVTEEVFVLSGTLDVLRSGNWVPLQTGQGLRFAADLPHGYRAGDRGAAFLNMHHYSQATEIPGQDRTSQ
ncbi:MAG: helix-turn-helix domain-containing protein [Ruegeria sp.]